LLINATVRLHALTVAGLLRRAVLPKSSPDFLRSRGYSDLSEHNPWPLNRLGTNENAHVHGNVVAPPESTTVALPFGTALRKS